MNTHFKHFLPDPKHEYLEDNTTEFREILLGIAAFDYNIGHTGQHSLSTGLGCGTDWRPHCTSQTCLPVVSGGFLRHREDAC